MSPHRVAHKSPMSLHCYGTARRLLPPPPWDIARCLWVLGYGHPERTIALYAWSAQPPRADYARFGVYVVIRVIFFAVNACNRKIVQSCKKFLAVSGVSRSHALPQKNVTRPDDFSVTRNCRKKKK